MTDTVSIRFDEGKEKIWSTNDVLTMLKRIIQYLYQFCVLNVIIQQFKKSGDIPALYASIDTDLDLLAYLLTFPDFKQSVQIPILLIVPSSS